MNAAAKVVALRNDSDDSAFDDLLDKRDHIVNELQRLSVVDAPVTAAEAVVGEVDRDTAALDAAERDAWQKWADTPDGNAPAPKKDERRALAMRRAEAAGDLDSARVAAAAIAPRRTQLNAELNRIGRELFLRKIRQAVDEGIRLNAEAHAIVEQIREPLARVAALRSALISCANTQENAGAQGAAHAALKGAESLDALPLPNVSFDGRTLNKYFAEWMGVLR
jgi:hypothetical protein